MIKAISHMQKGTSQGDLKGRPSGGSTLIRWILRFSAQLARAVEGSLKIYSATYTFFRRRARSSPL